MHRFSEFCLVLSAIVVFIVVMGLLYNFTSLDREIDSWKLLAETAPSSAEVYSHLSIVEEGLVRWGMSEGFAGIFKTDENDMSVKMAELRLIKTKAERLTMAPSDSDEYITNLNVLHEDLKKLDLKTKSYWNVHTGKGWWLTGGFFLHAGLIAFALWNKDRSSFTE